MADGKRHTQDVVVQGIELVTQFCVISTSGVADTLNLTNRERRFSYKVKIKVGLHSHPEGHHSL